MSDQSQPQVEQWAPPTSDSEFTFESIDSAPSWIDRNWASYSMGPALALPAGDMFGASPYTTITARVGDKVMFVAATPSKPAHFEVVAGEPTEDNATLKVPQVSAASLEDMLKTGVMVPDDLSEEARGQVLGRSPHLRRLIEDGVGAPEAVPVTEIVKVG